MVKELHQNGILQKAVSGATEKLAARGVEGCSTKEIILASFGLLSQNGGLATNEQLSLLTKEMRRFGWKVVSISVGALLAIIMVLIFV